MKLAFAYNITFRCKYRIVILKCKIRLNFSTAAFTSENFLITPNAYNSKGKHSTDIYEGRVRDRSVRSRGHYFFTMAYYSNIDITQILLRKLLTWRKLRLVEIFLCILFISHLKVITGGAKIRT